MGMALSDFLIPFVERAEENLRRRPGGTEELSARLNEGKERGNKKEGCNPQLVLLCQCSQTTKASRLALEGHAGSGQV